VTAAALPDSVVTMLDEAIIARVATVTPSGNPHAAPFWFSFDGERIVLDTLENATVRNLRSDPRVSVLVDLGTLFQELRGAMLLGSADLYSPDEAPQEVLRGVEVIRDRHAGEINTSDFQEYSRREHRPLAYVAITPHRAHWWNLARSDGTSQSKGAQ
jgi:nitroimidazol reductase NimA-like FMN-containing flavoprotein (pyridoxamine 5'-phosphate oxidase superfamily)